MYKTDQNQKEIVKALRQIGASVFNTAPLGKGFPDLVIGYRRKNYLIEVKTEKGKLTPHEEEFFNTWNGEVSLVRNIEDAIRVINGNFCI